MKNKKAVMNHVVSIILAALGIAIIVIAFTRYYAYTSEQEEEKAKNLLNILEAKINAMQEEETIEPSITGISEDWFLTGWSKDNPNRPKDKKECYASSCICICKGDGSERKESCETKNGFCKEVDKERVSILGEIITTGTILPGATISVEYIKLQPNLIKLRIDKIENALQIILES